MIEALLSYPENSSLLNEVNRQYRIDAGRLYLYRDMIGSVYFLESADRKYAFKLFRREDTDQALQSLAIIQYLKGCGFPVVPVVSTHSGDMCMMLEMPEGKRIGILYEYLEGIEPNLETDITSLGQQVGQLHNLMRAYPGPLVRRGKAFFIDRYIDLMKEYGYSTGKTSDLAEYGQRLWHSMEQLPEGFCHGDLHSGNIIKSAAGAYTLFDFDIASLAYPVIDAATLSDRTDFNRLDESAFDNTRWLFDKFYQGYARERILGDLEIAAIFDFIAIRHYELNATITSYRLPQRGRQWLDDAVFDEQYEWLTKWDDICSRKR